jgi:hypothetical protein
LKNLLRDVEILKKLYSSIKNDGVNMRENAKGQ